MDLIYAVGVGVGAQLAEWRSLHVRPPPRAGGGGHERAWQRREPGKRGPLCIVPGAPAPGQVVVCYWRPRECYNSEAMALVLAAMVGVPGFGEPGRYRTCRAATPKAKLASKGVPSG